MTWFTDASKQYLLSTSSVTDTVRHWKYRGEYESWVPDLIEFIFWWSEASQSCLTLCDPITGACPGSSILGIFQARILEWVATCFSRGSSQPRDRTRVSCISGRRFTLWATREAHICCIHSSIYICQSQSPSSSLSPISPLVSKCLSSLCLYFCFANKLTYSIFLDSVYMH